MIKIGNDWDGLLKDEWEKPYYRKLRSFLIEEYRNETVYPPETDIFTALKLTAYEDVKVVILGQDPYHEPGQAVGLAFSVPGGMKMPPSLVNIMKELTSDTAAMQSANNSDGKLRSELSAQAITTGGVLAPWARQGVLLLNTVLTVRAHQAGSHRGAGWEQFTDRIIELLAARRTPMVFVLWGAQAIAKKELILRAEADSNSNHNNANNNNNTNNGGINIKRHLIITAPHPSPLSAHRGFFGGRYFSRCNYFLSDNDIEPIDWSLDVR